MRVAGDKPPLSNREYKPLGGTTVKLSQAEMLGVFDYLEEREIGKERKNKF